MLERKNFKVAKGAAKAFRNNGNSGVDSFIEANILDKRFKPSVQRAWDSNIKKFKRGENFMWKNRLITPLVIPLTHVVAQKITFVDKDKEKE